MPSPRAPRTAPYLSPLATPSPSPASTGHRHNMMVAFTTMVRYVVGSCGWHVGPLQLEDDNTTTTWKPFFGSSLGATRRSADDAIVLKCFSEGALRLFRLPVVFQRLSARQADWYGACLFACVLHLVRSSRPISDFYSHLLCASVSAPSQIEQWDLLDI